MPVLFLILLFAAALSCYCHFLKRNSFSFRLTDICFIVILAYFIFFLSLVPLLWLDRWTIPLHLASLLVITCIPIYQTLLKRVILRFQKGTREQGAGGGGLISEKEGCTFSEVFIFLGIGVLGIALQWKGIFHLYATHDPGAYLTAALHLNRTHHFSYRDPMVALASRHAELEPLLLEHGKDDLQLSNYGVIEKKDQPGHFYFHGMPGESVWLALGANLFGEAQCMR
ncbi:MAG: hypothetical protein HY537_00560, partial [Deltaproteobacteria bacterium]|nr:hypothetical protein [Deltaproteobacteria bacterium]